MLEREPPVTGHVVGVRVRLEHDLTRADACALGTHHAVRDVELHRRRLLEDQAAVGSGAIGQGAYVDGPRKSFSGGAGLVSTAHDYARFLQMLLNGGELDGTRLLGPKTVELMTQNHLPEGVAFRSGEGFGLGFSVVLDAGLRGVPGSAGEYGWGGAYHSTYWVDPAEELVVVYMTQLLPAGDIDDSGKLRALVYQAIID